jgi:hypothetical protein
MAQTYSLIQAQTLTSSAASVTFSNIPQNFTDLKIVVSAAIGSTATDLYELYFNGQARATVSTNAVRWLSGSGSAASSDARTSYPFAVTVNMTNQTANTFASTEIYIPNYTSSRVKSWSSDTSNENNATAASIYLFGGHWSNTAAITSVSILSEGSTLSPNSTFYLYGIDGTRATGGTITSDANYTYHTFTSSNTFTALEKINNAEILLVAGGGGGGFGSGAGGAGGGAGGVTSTIGQTFTAGTSYSAIVGAGGSGSASGSGTKGANSQFSSITAANGGGFGAGGGSGAGGTGGSGGGGAYTALTGGTASPAGQGNNGGEGSDPSANQATGGGGGGAGRAGTNSVGLFAGGGGAGTDNYAYWHSITSTGVSLSGSYYIAGGGGGGAGTSGTAGAGGAGGGGAGTKTNAGNGVAGTANTGGGGGGCGWQDSVSSGAGGSGLVIIRYPNI